MLPIFWFQGRIQDFKLGGGGGALKKIAPSGGRRENVWGISCQKSRFYAKNHIFSNFRGGGAPPPPPLDPPLVCTDRSFKKIFSISCMFYSERMCTHICSVYI